MPERPPLPAFSSALFAQLFGNEMSKAPKKEIAKNIKIAKNNRLVIGLVDMLYKALPPNTKVIRSVGMV